MPKIEILAPVGSEEMLRAAVFSGADAVYLGFSGFNARTGAGNFDADSLKEAVRFCHARGVKVHVALNTTVYGGELAALAGAVKAVAESGADAAYYKAAMSGNERRADGSLIPGDALQVKTMSGIGQPLICERQYRKMVGREVDVVLRDGRKLTAEAKAFDGGALTLAYAEKVAVEGKKRRQSVIREETIPLDAIKTTAEHLNFR